MKHFELGEYKGLNLKCFDTSVKEHEINNAMDYLVNFSQESEINKNNEPIELGDYVLVDIVGVEKNISVPVLNECDYQFRVGDDGLICELNENILGKKSGDKVIFDTIIKPISIDSQKYWGREITFNIDIKRVFIIEKPELTEDIIQEIDPSLKTLQDLKQKLTEKIFDEKRAKKWEANINIVFQALIEKSKYEFEEESLNQAAEDLYKKFAEELKKAEGMELIVYLIGRKMSADELLEECKEEAAKRMIRNRILDAVIETEKIGLTAEERGYLEDRLRKDQESGQSSEMFTDIHFVETQYLRRKAMDFLLNVNMVN
ncbi:MULTISPECIES: trigger factor [unclassified Dehalobacter]|uniref:trigger factor n=1 Tax=unclassified Dehalobacter TaxID=2635733 RepID=UPI000E6BD46B|nr:MULTISPECIES: trigger factor [unclassified Dehalobacter]RJE48645.1 trigger factor [Dehalobacter sp. MCB1]TCX47273.1 trigger factor [Dehalobacter sp. 14DCB1]TCX55695.1 trigger factor [Dehalobacter sp. 12DCB1]